ncbi:MAG: SDR family oxidoreductase [Bacteroidia bacterium]|nr:SDR family oxidoreductase [Bacteroidia bacterium]
MKFANKIVWITGASSGIGEALLYEFVHEGAEVIASARRVNELERVRENCGENKEKVRILPLDLTDIEGIQQAATQAGRVDILINNGGISQRSLAHETPLEVDRKIFEVNYFGQVALTKAVLPGMIEQGGGQVVAVSSITGKFGFPLRSAYSATKHALHGFFETLGFELADKNIQVSVINPGRIRTNISLHALQKDGSPQESMDKGLDEGMAPEDCAKRMLKAIYQKKPEANIGGKEIMMVYFKRYMPWLFRRIASKVDPK